MASAEFTHEPDANRYTLMVDGKVGSIVEYNKNGNSIALTHTFTPPPARGHGYAGQLVQHVVDDIEQNTSLRIVPACSYVHGWFEKHTDRQDLLAR